MNGGPRGIRRNPAPQTPRKDAGFTLTELVVTISIASILMVLAVPSFNGVIATERAKAAASELYISLVTARAEAIRLDQPVSTSENSGDWKNGWTTRSGGTTLDSHGATNAFSIVEASGSTSVTYNPSGRLTLGAAPMFVISTKNGSSTIYQCVSIDPTGTPYIHAASTC